MIKVFVDTDVVISSLISATGAAFILLNQTEELDLYISNLSEREIEEVVLRLNLDIKKAHNFIENQFSKVKLEETNKEIKIQFGEYVSDPDDAHIVAGAKESSSQFLISYNIKHFIADKIKNDFNIVVTTPANLLQYLRSK